MIDSRSQMVPVCVASAGICEFGDCVKSNCDLRGGDTLTIELRRVLSGVLREPGKSDACMCKSRFIEGDTRHAVEVESQIYCMLNVLY